MIPALNRRLLSSHRILVAFNGNLDPTALLHQLAQWRMENSGVTLRAIHAYHGLSTNADAQVKHYENICQQWQALLVVEHVQLVQEELGIEARARQARYQVSARTLLPGEVPVTAQHLGDQCGTFLLALKRGSGPTGLSVMTEVPGFVGTQLTHPLSTRTRGELVQWVLVHGLHRIEDESGRDDNYDRNPLHLRVVPLLQQRQLYFAKAAVRSTALCVE